MKDNIPTIKTHSYSWDASRIKEIKNNREFNYTKEERFRRNEMAKIRYKLNFVAITVKEKVELEQQLKQFKKIKK